MTRHSAVTDDLDRVGAREVCRVRSLAIRERALSAVLARIVQTVPMGDESRARIAALLGGADDATR